MRSNTLAEILLTLSVVTTAACEAPPLLEPSFKKTLADPGACVDTPPPPLPVPLKSPAAAGFFDGNIYVFGGTRADTNQPSRAVYRYSPAGGPVVEIATLPNDNFVASHAFAAGNRIFVTTGRRVWVFDPIIGSIESLSDAPVTLIGGAAAMDGGFVLFGEENLVASFRFDNRNWGILPPTRSGTNEASVTGAGLPNFDLLELTPTKFLVRHEGHSGVKWLSLPSPHAHHAGAAVIQIDDRFLRFGGWRMSDQTYAADDTVEAYDITTGEWTLGPALERQIVDASVAQSCGKRVYLFGSTDLKTPETAAEYARVVRYDPEKAEWKVSQ